MASILTLTLNPTIDASTSVARMEPIHKLRCGPARRQPGGGGINVARVVRRLGGDVVAAYPVGGLIGAHLRNLMDDEGVESRALVIAGETRENFTVFEEAGNEHYRFVLPGPQLSEREWRACLDAVERFDRELSFIVASGSLPPGVPADVLGALSALARAKGTKLVVDSGGAELQAALVKGVHLIKPNLREMRALTGEPLADRDAWLRACRKLVAAGGVELIALTVAEHGALLVGREGAWLAEGVPVEMVSAVGAGDSFLGAFVWAASQGHAPEEALRHGVAAGSAALLSPDTDLCRIEDLKRLLPQVKIEAIAA